MAVTGRFEFLIPETSPFLNHCSGKDCYDNYILSDSIFVGPKHTV